MRYTEARIWASFNCIKSSHFLVRIVPQVRVRSSHITSSPVRKLPNPLKSLSNLNDRMSQLELELQQKAEKVEYEKFNERLTKITSMVELQRQDTDSSLREVRKNIEEMD